MADPRLPDVVPLSMTNTKHDCYQGNAEPLDSQALPSSEWSTSVVTYPGKTPLVQIWTSTEDDGHVEVELPGTPCGGRRCSTLSEAGCNDSGIDSQLASPIPSSETTDRCPVADNFSNAGSSGSHLAVPKLVPSLSQKRLKLANSPISWRVTVQDEEITEHVPVDIPVPRVVSPPAAGKSSTAAAAAASPTSSPRSRTLQRSLAQTDYGLTAWRLRSDSLCKMRLSITDETLNPHIYIESPAESQQQHRSLDGTNQQKHHKSVGTRHSLDERFMQRHQTRVSLDDSSTATSITQQGSISNLSQESTSSVQLPDFTKSVSDCYSSSEEEPATFSRHPSFCSVRSDFAAVGAAYRDEGEQQRNQLGRLLSRSSSRPLYLSVPPRLANIQWSTFAQSQPGSRRPSTFSQLGSMSSLASRFSLTNRSLSSTASPYCRLDSRDRQRLANEESLESATFISLSNQDLFVSNALSLTQRLAFPQLASPQEGGKNRLRRDGHIETESNLNFFAKIITFLVLVFAIVLFVGVLIKLYHGPQ